MIIHRPTSMRSPDGEPGTTRIGARIETAGGRRLPSELWFEFAGGHRPLDNSRADPFVVALLLLAMQRGEGIEVRGPLSRTLHAGLEGYQDVFRSWYPERFRKIEIRPTALVETAVERPPGAACAFSGGVDSFYTLLARRGRIAGAAGAEPPLTHALFMAGFDQPLHLRDSIAALRDAYAELMAELGLTLVSGRTNVRAFVNSVDWTNAHGPALAASALFFDGQWARFDVPASYVSGSYPKWGSHPGLDFRLSTAGLRFVHHGDGLNRVRKLAHISRAPESYARLRVCWIQDIGLRNCGECEKCVRTMVALDVLGALPRYATFGQTRLPRARVRALPHRTHQSRLFARELMREAAARGKFGAFWDLGYSLLRREAYFRSRAWRAARPAVGRLNPRSEAQHP